MIHPFRPYEVEPTPAHPSGTTYRPTISIFVGGPSRSRGLIGLLDTGADETLMPITVAASLGVELDDSRPFLFEGFGGRPVVARYGLVTLELRQRPPGWWPESRPGEGPNREPPAATPLS